MKTVSLGLQVIGSQQLTPVRLRAFQRVEKNPDASITQNWKRTGTVVKNTLPQAFILDLTQ